MGQEESLMQADFPKDMETEILEDYEILNVGDLKPVL